MAFDVQGFLVNNKFIAKEIAIFDYEWKTAHFILKPPVDLCANAYKLSKKDYRQIRWLTENYHGLEWFDGFVDYEQLESLIKPILSAYNTIYICGNQKEQFLETLGLNDKAIDMRIVGNEFRRLSDMVENENNRCIYHKKSMKNMCALKNAYDIAYYFLNK